MLVMWWVVSIEIPGRNLFLIAAQRGIDMKLAPISVWAFSLTQTAMSYRFLAGLFIVAGVIVHRLLRVRQGGWDIFGKWVYKAAFLVLYIFLYGLFLLIFIGAELPVWRGL